MSVIFELVIINSSKHKLLLVNESLITGTSDIQSRPLLIASKGVQRYKFRSGLREVLEGTVTFRVEDNTMQRCEFTVDFYHLNNQWAAIEMPTPACLKRFQRSYILDGTTFLDKKTLSMAVEFSNITEKG